MPPPAARSWSATADDLIALCHSRQQAEQVQARLAGWLEPRGLAFNQDKTKITHLDQGVDFLGFEIRRFGGKLLTKPSKDALRQIRNRLSAEVTALRGANADAVTGRLNPVITGWAAYYRIGVSSLAYNRLDAHVWRLAWKWARHTHPGKPGHWVVSRYFRHVQPVQERQVGVREPGKPATTCAGSPGPRSSGTRWPPGGHPPMTPPWPDTGPSAASAPGPRSAPRPGTCCAASTAGARSAGGCCSTPATSLMTSASGSSGTPSSGKRSASRRSPP